MEVTYWDTPIYRDGTVLKKPLGWDRVNVQIIFSVIIRQHNQQLSTWQHWRILVCWLYKKQQRGWNEMWNFIARLCDNTAGMGTWRYYWMIDYIVVTLREQLFFLFLFFFFLFSLNIPGLSLLIITLLLMPKHTSIPKATHC